LQEPKAQILQIAAGEATLSWISMPRFRAAADGVPVIAVAACPTPNIDNVERPPPLRLI
jgi:hypothetical protein